MLDWILNKLGLMRVCDHEKSYTSMRAEWADDAEQYEEQIDRMNSHIAWAETNYEIAQGIRDKKHCRETARLQREVDYWRAEAEKARGER